MQSNLSTPDEARMAAEQAAFMHGRMLGRAGKPCPCNLMTYIRGVDPEHAIALYLNEVRGNQLGLDEHRQSVRKARRAQLRLRKARCISVGVAFVAAWIAFCCSVWVLMDLMK